MSFDTFSSGKVCALRLIALGGAQVTGKDVELKLPDYIVLLPFVFLEPLPITPNGKVDRRAFPLLII